MLTFKPQIVPNTTSQTEESGISADAIYDMLETLDELHSQISDGTVNDNINTSSSEIIAALRDLIFTAQETIDELSTYDVQAQPTLQIVEKIKRVG